MMLVAFLGGKAPARVFLQDSTTPDAVVNSPADAFCLFRLNVSGAGQRNHAGSYITQFTWLLSGAASDYECRMSTGSGTLSTGTAGSWLPLSSTQEWSRSRTGIGTAAYTGTLEIRDASTLVVLASATVTLTATVEI